MSQPDPTVTLFDSLYLNNYKSDKNVKKYEKMHTILNCDLSIFQTELPNAAIMRSIQIDEIFNIIGKT